MEMPAHLSAYPKGVPHEIDADKFSSLLEVFEKAIKKYQQKTAFVNMGVTLSFARLDEQSRDFAAFLQSRGLRPGDRIAIQMPNLLQYPVVMLAAIRAGLVVVNTNPLYTAREMEHQFRDSGAKALVVLSNFGHNVEKVLARTAIKTVIVTQIGDMLPFPKSLLVNAVVKYVKKMVPAYQLPGAISLPSALREGRKLNLQPVTLKRDDLAFIQYTGGTTGVAKGAMLTHRNLIANMLQIRAWMGDHLEEGKETVITALPLYHIFALTVNCMVFIDMGAQNVLISNPRDMKAFIGELKKYPFSVMTGVNTLFAGLLNQPDFRELDFSHLRVVVAGGAALQTPVAKRWKEVTGNDIAEGYGLSETAPVLTVNPIDGTCQVGTIGLPVPSTRVKIVKEDGTEAPMGEPGEICAKGPQVMGGYWQRPEDTRKSFDADGWFKTGDIAIALEDGFYKIVDRKKDMILVSGFNVYPNEIEEVLSGCPGVAEVAAVGVPDAKSGEAVKVFIVRNDATLTVERVKAYCKEHLTAYKNPRKIEFRTELPKSTVGKILRRELQAQEVAQ